MSLVFSYLQSSALIREWGTEESGDNAHHYFCDVLLQYGVSVLSVAGVVASLQDNSLLDQKQLNQNRLIRRCLILHHSSQGRMILASLYFQYVQRQTPTLSLFQYVGIEHV